MPHPAMSPAMSPSSPGAPPASGSAAAKRFAGLGMKVCIADIDADRLEEAAAKTGVRRERRRRRCHDGDRRRQPRRDLAGLETAVQSGSAAPTS